MFLIDPVEKVRILTFVKTMKKDQWNVRASHLQREKDMKN